MTTYKVEAFTYYTKVSLDKNHIVKSSKVEIQNTLDAYVRDGWRLVSTDATSFGQAVYVYLYFEKDDAA